MKIIQDNKEANFNYQFLETFEAGLVLTGPEVKSAKAGQISLRGSYVSIGPEGEAWLVNCHISAYQPARGQQADYDPERRRKLLLHKKEIDSLIGKSRQKGLTIVPTSVYTKKGLIKLGLALARGKSQRDKRETIKKREVQREIKNAYKRRG